MRLKLVSNQRKRGSIFLTVLMILVKLMSRLIWRVVNFWQKKQIEESSLTS